MELENITQKRNGWSLNLNLWLFLLTVNKTHKMSDIMALKVTGNI